MLVDSFVGVPLDSSGAFAGCERMPAALRAAGLADLLMVEDLGNLQVALADPVRDPATGIIGFGDLVAASAVIRSATRDLLEAGRRPLLVGGCCSLLIGAMAGVRDVYPGAGLAFLDGHLDFHSGMSSPTGEAADLELAILLGVGPPELTGLTGGSRIVDSGQVIHLGARDTLETQRLGAPNPAVDAPDMHVIALSDIRAAGSEQTGRIARRDLQSTTSGYWVHLDLDILSTECFPAVDYAQPDGLDWSELAALVAPLVSAPTFLGMNVTILNATKDVGGQSAAATVRFLADVLA
jgi:arginase